QKLRDREAKQQEELHRVNDQLENVPNAAAIRRVAGTFSRRYSDARLVGKKIKAETRYDLMTWDEKRALVQSVFGGTVPDGRGMGVFIRWLPGDKRSPEWRFSIRGQLVETDLVPRSDEFLRRIYDPNEENGDVSGYALHSRARAPRGCRSRALGA